MKYPSLSDPEVRRILAEQAQRELLNSSLFAQILRDGPIRRDFDPDELRYEVLRVDDRTVVLRPKHAR